MDFDVVTRRAEILVGRIGFGLRSGDDLELQRLTRSRVEHRFVGSDASLSNGIEVESRARPRFGHFVIDSKLMTLRREQLIARVAVRRNELSGRRCRYEQDDEKW